MPPTCDPESGSLNTRNRFAELAPDYSYYASSFIQVRVSAAVNQLDGWRSVPRLAMMQIRGSQCSLLISRHLHKSRVRDQLALQCHSRTSTNEKDLAFPLDLDLRAVDVQTCSTLT